MSRTKVAVAVILMLLGTNVFTYATTRYLTTKTVLVRASQNMEKALRDLGAYEDLESRRSVAYALAIPMAGGMYYWWNDALPWFGLAAVMTIAGIWLPFTSNRVKGT